jgi:two-component system, chemotaxis family, CheB/CheR fusion protein
LSSPQASRAAQLEEALEAVDDAVVIFDRSGEVIHANAAYEAVRTARRFFDADGEPLPADQTPPARLGRGDLLDGQFMTEAADGTRRWHEAVFRPADGERPYGVLIIRDVSERSLRELHEHFVSIASHELRTPLTVLQGYLQMLERQLEPPGSGASSRYLSKALAQTRRLAELIGNLLDVGRLEAGKLVLEPEPIDLVEVARSAVETARRLAEGQRVVLEADGPVPVEGDPARLEQVILNLLTNAVHHARGSEQVDVRVRAEPEFARVEVQDYGPGISARDQRRLFRRFHQAAGERHGGGLGLGLYIAREIVELHGGQIGVDSTPGDGAVFWFAVPAVAGAPRSPG